MNEKKLNIKNNEFTGSTQTIKDKDKSLTNSIKSPNVKSSIDFNKIKLNDKLKDLNNHLESLTKSHEELKLKYDKVLRSNIDLKK